MKIYTENKKEVTKLYNTNQDIKNIFSEYTILPNGLTIGIPILEKGSHCILNGYELPNIDEKNIMIEPFIYSSKQIFDSIKENKKIIDSIVLIKNTLSFLSSTTSQIFEIGRVMNSSDSKTFDNNMVEFDRAKERKWLSLSEDDVKDLVGNKIIEIKEDKYRTRISRELMPGLKKSHSVSISFEESTNEIFKIIIMVQRAYVTSIHIYSALYY